MKKFAQITLIAASGLLLAGCAAKPLPSEDIEIFELYPEEIAILKNPALRSSSKEKYDAIKRLITKVDFTFTRNVKTIDSLLYHGDGTPDATNRPDRTITFNYQYGDHYVRLIFSLYENIVTRVEVVEK